MSFRSVTSRSGHSHKRSTQRANRATTIGSTTHTTGGDVGIQMTQAQPDIPEKEQMKRSRSITGGSIQDTSHLV